LASRRRERIVWLRKKGGARCAEEREEHVDLIKTQQQPVSWKRVKREKARFEKDRERGKGSADSCHLQSRKRNTQELDSGLTKPKPDLRKSPDFILGKVQTLAFREKNRQRRRNDNLCPRARIHERGGSKGPRISTRRSQYKKPLGLSIN